MDEFNSKYWSRILNSRYDLKRSENLYKINKLLTIKDLLDFYKNFFKENDGKFSLQLVCKKCQGNEAKFDEKEQKLRCFDKIETTTVDIEFFT